MSVYSEYDEGYDDGYARGYDKGYIAGAAEQLKRCEDAVKKYNKNMPNECGTKNGSIIKDILSAIRAAGVKP